MKRQFDHTPKRKIAKWFDKKTNTYYERDIRNGKMLYVRKFAKGESYGS